MKKSISLFFIPILPYDSEYLLICPICSRGWVVKESNVDAAKEMNEITTRFQNEEIKERTYKKHTQKFKKILFEDEQE
jgi:hypothetical protein